MKSLRGKGFIYIAPDRGKESFVEADSMAQDLWALANGHRLLLTLLHELGHVYGIPTTDATGI